MKFHNELPLPDLLDLSKNETDIGYIEITCNHHKFAPDAKESGFNFKKNPIFGCKYGVNKTTSSLLNYGLPFFRFKKGQKVNVEIENNTGYYFDLHWHGLNTTADIDGASTEVDFGKNTKIGTKLIIPFPKITNNSALLWVHTHPMFITSEFVYRGIFGLVEIIDEESKIMQELFQYKNNHVMMVYQDFEFNSDGTLNDNNLYTDAERSNFGVINGISCMNWYNDNKVKYETNLYHKSNRNLVKIDILNGTETFRNMYLGVCDKNDQIKKFYLIQTDTGLRKPELLDMVEIGPANRISILIDLNDFTDYKAYIFLYNFDLTEVFNINLNTKNPNNTYLQANVQDLNKTSNPTPNPTPIPDPNNENVDQNPSNLIYPKVPAIPQINNRVPLGKMIPPKKTHTKYNIKKFLKIKLNKHNCDKSFDINYVLHKINKIVFGKSNYLKYKELIDSDNFENNKLGINYISLLNKKYFYNIPDITDSPTRNFIFYPDNGQNYNGSGGNPYGSTEYINGANRIIVDMWNSKELDFSNALYQYNLSPNNYQPNILPTCLFKIYQENMKYINYDMLSNDRLTIQFFNKSINYGKLKLNPVSQVTVTFPQTNKPLNINQWKNLVNTIFGKTVININKKQIKLSSILKYDWSFYPYYVSYLMPKTQYIKSVMVKTNNNSNYCIKFIGNWSLLQYFGKPMAANMVNDMDNNVSNNMINRFPNNYNQNIQQIYPQYGTTDPLNPITTFDNTAELIISPQSIYYGIIDGFQNDGYMNFSVEMNSSEKWNYHNLDNQDVHPFHFHMTSGFLDAQSSVNSKGLLDAKYSPILYSMDTYGVGSQNSLSFYIKFPNYNSAISVLKPAVKYLGYSTHCHYLLHHDMNMMGQYFVYINRSDYF